MIERAATSRRFFTAGGATVVTTGCSNISSDNEAEKRVDSEEMNADVEENEMNDI